MLESAARGGHVEVVRLLVDHGADVNAGGGKILRAAVNYKRLEVVRFLVEHGVEVTADTSWASRRASFRGQYYRWNSKESIHLDIVCILLQNGADANTGRKHWDELLRLAHRRGDPSIVRFLETKGIIGTAGR
jgi:ankyrin repeat protein